MAISEPILLVTLLILSLLVNSGSAGFFGSTDILGSVFVLFLAIIAVLFLALRLGALKESLLPPKELLSNPAEDNVSDPDMPEENGLESDIPELDVVVVVVVDDDPPRF